MDWLSKRRELLRSKSLSHIEFPVEVNVDLARKVVEPCDGVRMEEVFRSSNISDAPEYDSSLRTVMLSLQDSMVQESYLSRKQLWFRVLSCVIFFLFLFFKSVTG